MKWYTHESEIFCLRGCVKLPEAELPRCASKVIYGDVTKPHTVMIGTCDRKIWKRKEEKSEDSTRSG